MKTIVLATTLLVASCHPRGPAAVPPPEVPADEPGPGPASVLRSDLDLDADGAPDELLARFSGGAHCCYSVGARFGGSPDEEWLPFHLDGGYGPGAGLGSEPERFQVLEPDGALPEIVMEIETYNGEPQPLPAEWQRSLGVTSHRVAVRFPGRRPAIRNLSDIEPARPDQD